MNAKKMLTVIGIVLLAIGIFKVSVLGYYPREAPIFIGILAIGSICAFIGHKLPSK